MTYMQSQPDMVYGSFCLELPVGIAGTRPDGLLTYHCVVQDEFTDPNGQCFRGLMPGDQIIVYAENRNDIQYEELERQKQELAYIEMLRAEQEMTQHEMFNYNIMQPELERIAKEDPYEFLRMAGFVKKPVVMPPWHNPEVQQRLEQFLNPLPRVPVLPLFAGDIVGPNIKPDAFLLPYAANETPPMRKDILYTGFVDLDDNDYKISVPGKDGKEEVFIFHGKQRDVDIHDWMTWIGFGHKTLVMRPEAAFA